VDAVSDRDFALDLVYAATVIGLHLSRLGEDVVLWSSTEFGFLRLADQVATGSSLMPQKKNPDIAELIRGRSGRSLGCLVSLATVLKGLPLAYDRDLQETKEPVFAAVLNAGECLKAARIVVEHFDFDRQRMQDAVADPDLYATDSAELLVASGTPFRQAHQQIARQVREGKHQPEWGAAQSLQMRDLPGGPHPRRVAARARAVLPEVERLRAWAESHPVR
jgi:argininosuccinate lyase